MSERKPEILLRHYLKKLKLPTILREYQSMAAVCTKDRCDYTTFLLRLVESDGDDRTETIRANVKAIGEPGHFDP